MNDGIVSQDSLIQRNRALLRERFTNHEEFMRLARLAVREAILDHKRTGHPIAVSKDGKSIWIPADEIVVPED